MLGLASLHGYMKHELMNAKIYNIICHKPSHEMVWKLYFSRGEFFPYAALKSAQHLFSSGACEQCCPDETAFEASEKIASFSKLDQ